ncbi:anti-adapter protein IraP [Hafnia psychrotolerans]|uniref:Anti-RssB factor n=1 Tax=Hafnia psychrotolerans TaxID=1477018 RepID=A0ABQ1GEP6_9GAMM|nr:anti-adapter protein IraP [Hafnia psychrotolerans]GGA42182.1 anti-RssB factor [Hafnia psychrotolerans]
MKNLMIDVLIKLSKVEVESKELVAQVEAQSLLIAALLLTLGNEATDDLSTNIHSAVAAATQSSTEILQSDADMILAHFDRLLKVTKFVADHAEEE